MHERWRRPAGTCALTASLCPTLHSTLDCYNHDTTLTTISAPPCVRLAPRDEHGVPCMNHRAPDPLAPASLRTLICRKQQQTDCRPPFLKILPISSPQVSTLPSSQTTCRMHSHKPLALVPHSSPTTAETPPRTGAGGLSPSPALQGIPRVPDSQHGKTPPQLSQARKKAGQRLESLREL